MFEVGGGVWWLFVRGWGLLLLLLACCCVDLVQLDECYSARLYKQSGRAWKAVKSVVKDKA